MKKEIIVDFAMPGIRNSNRKMRTTIKKYDELFTVGVI